MSSVFYDMANFHDKCDLLDDALLILAIDGEERSQYAITQFKERTNKANGAIVFSYEESTNNHSAIEIVESITPKDEISIVDGFPDSQYGFIEKLKSCEQLVSAQNIVIDISCILTPYLFLLLKCLYLWNKEATISVINTIPFDYSFSKSPFTSYRSFYGDLKMEEIFGFSGSNGGCENKELYIFAGFEGALALKVIEDIDYNQLFLVNALPSYYQKYKDISVINNYQLIVSHNCKKLYTPAINPFETYNLLNRYVKKDTNVSIAPLCTKPIALGICLYALEHDNVRIIYPFSDRYESDRSHDVHKAYVYRIK